MKKFMKALALALALCMVLSVSAFAADLGATPEDGVVDSEARTVTFTVTGVPANEQVALLILADGATLATANEDNILYIDQTAATEDGASFVATIKEGNDKVDVYVGSATISSSAAWEVYPDLVIAETSSITLATGENFKILAPGTEEGQTGTVQYGVAIKMHLNKINVEKMIWAFGDGSKKVYSKPVMLNYTDMATLEGDTWFTAAVAPSIIGTDNNQLSALTTVNAIFRCNNQNYFTDATDEDNEAEAN